MTLNVWGVANGILLADLVLNRDRRDQDAHNAATARAEAKAYWAAHDGLCKGCDNAWGEPAYLDRHIHSTPSCYKAYIKLRHPSVMAREARKRRICRKLMPWTYAAYAFLFVFLAMNWNAK